MKRLQVYVIVLGAALLLMNCAGGKTANVASVLEKFQKGYKTRDPSLMQVCMNQSGMDTLDGDYILVVTNTMFKEGLFWDKSYPVRKDNDKYLMAIPWKKEDGKVHAFLEKYDDDQYFSYYRQECAQRMLSSTDLLKDKSKEGLNALAFYTNIMLEEHTYCPGLMLCSLEKLKKVWPREKIRLAATLVVREHPKYRELNKKLVSDFSKMGNKSGADMVLVYTEIMRQNDLYVKRLQKI
ncbi:hypothetical protein [Dyadobacter pollutisoli]|uniref:Lipoprotein n=1 Tax=Dyadobacter pollutisoli TaxID=2910158 RepID=A0A9E8SKN1_9BACT|nr:hypothetical protein [Dyadobacter pollutisoli]WAC11399.1 hypothetical protein ON006_27160 [Dyadobacter pollutisoli]